MDTELNISTTSCNDSNGSLLCNDTLAEVEETQIQLYIVVSILSIFCVVGTIGNATSFYIYFKRRDKSTSVIFILALAGTDFLTCLIIVPYTIVFELLEYKFIYDFPCKLYLFLITSNIPFSAYIMTAIAFDRYFCICHPFLQAFTVSRAKIIVCCLACLAFTFGIITSVSYGTYSLESDQSIDEYMIEDGISHNNTFDYNDAIIIRNETFNIENDTFDAVESEPRSLVHVEYCHQNGILVGLDFTTDYYSKVYTATFIVAFIIVVVLYCMIYYSILMRRSQKAKRKKKNVYISVAVTEPEKTTMNNTLTTSLNGNATTTTTTTTTTEKVPEKPKQKTKRPSTVKDTNLYANIKTAMMLFVVTIVFTIAFLPALLMSVDLLPFNMIVFYMYFSYNVVNPFIYAFMNQTFRDDLKNINKMCK